MTLTAEQKHLVAWLNSGSSINTHDAKKAAALISSMGEENAKLRKLDAEAATHVETYICMRTNFTGNPPYVGWKGLGLAMTEAFDERDRLSERLEDAEGYILLLLDSTELGAAAVDAAETAARAFLSSKGGADE